MRTLTIDLETVPAQLPWVRDELALTIKPPGTLKKPESIAEWERDSKPAAVDDAWLKTSFDGSFGQIVVIGWAVDDEPTQAISVADLSAAAERDLLARFYAVISKECSGTSGLRPALVGHNLVGFDLPMLAKRSVIHQVRPPIWWPRDPKPWSDTVADTMVMWAGAKDRISMDRLCKVLGIEGKGGMSGADVWPMVKEGRIDEVAAYCKADVERTRRIYQRLMFAQAAS